MRQSKVATEIGEALAVHGRRAAGSLERIHEERGLELDVGVIEHRSHELPDGRKHRPELVEHKCKHGRPATGLERSNGREQQLGIDGLDGGHGSRRHPATLQQMRPQRLHRACVERWSVGCCIDRHRAAYREALLQLGVEQREPVICVSERARCQQQRHHTTSRRPRALQRPRDRMRELHAMIPSCI